MRPESLRTASALHDSEAVADMPMTLMITVIVLAITIPMTFGSLRAYDRSRVESSLMLEIDCFVEKARLVYVSGPGNSAVVEFNAGPGSMTGIEYVAFGDEPGGPMASVIRYKLQGRAEQSAPPIWPGMPLTSSSGTELTLASGTHRIRVECRSGDGAPGSESAATYVILEIIQ